MTGLAVNAPTLFRTGAIASAWNFSVQLANSTFQNCNTTVSVQYVNVSLRNVLSVNMRVISSMVFDGRSSSARMVYRRVYSHRGPQLSPNIRFNTPITSELMLVLCAGFVTSSGLNPSG